MKTAEMFCAVVLFAVFGGVCYASHFRGGMITWKPVSPNSHTVFIDFRLGWRKSSQGTFCRNNNSTINVGKWYCSGCYQSVIGSAELYCIDHSDEEDWVQGANNLTYTFNGNGPFTIKYSSCCWISMLTGGSLSWIVQATVDLNTRSDTGTINSSPISTTAPLVRLGYLCKRAIKIPVEDPDGDTVRCRWASSSESGGVSQNFYYGTLYEENCTLYYNGNSQVGLYPVALQIEDFAAGTSSYNPYNALSSIPLQFIISLETNYTCGKEPKLTGRTPQDGTCLDIPSGTTLVLRIEASHEYQDPKISSFITEVPSGMIKTSLDMRIGSYGENIYFVDLVWTPTTGQYGIHIVCFKALDNLGVESKKRCVTLLAGSSSTPSMSSVSRTVGTYDITWTVTFDHKIQKPRQTRYIRFFLQNHEVFKIDTSSSDVSILSGKQKLQFRSPRAVAETYGYKNVILDEGGIEGEGCQQSGPPASKTYLASLGYYSGSCPSGYHYFQGNCQDIDECSGQSSSSYQASNYSSFQNFTLRMPGICEYQCVNTNGGYHCVCATGYSLDSDRKTCIDINECRIQNGGCSHVCSNMPGTYQCQCPNSAFIMLQDNKTCEAQGLDLICHSHHMEVTFERKMVFGMNDKSLHLNDPQCKAEGNWTHVTLRAPLNGCGTTHNESGNHINYYNKVINTIMVSSGVVTRTQEVEISIKCSYEKTGNASSGGVEPWNRKSTQETSSYGRFTYLMDMFPTSQYEDAYVEKQFPLTVTLDDRLYAQVTVQSNGSDLILFLDSCQATPSPDPHDYPRYTFLEYGCNNDPTLQYDLKVRSFQQFSIQAFRFIGDYPMVYLHCEMLVCHKNKDNSRCRKGCVPYNGRRRREVEDASEKTALTFGPVILNKGKNSDENQEKGNTSASVMNTAVISGIAGVAALLSIILIVVLLRRRTPAHNGIVKTADTKVELQMGFGNDGFEKQDNLEI